MANVQELRQMTNQELAELELKLMAAHITCRESRSRKR